MKKIAWCHLIYIVVIFLTILFCVIICLSRTSVSDAAMDNVSFASSIVSIVLAVVSIIVSLYATFHTSANLGSMQDVARGIRRSLKHLRNLKGIATDTNQTLKKLTASSLSKAPKELIEEKQQEEDAEVADIENSASADSNRQQEKAENAQTPSTPANSAEQPTAATQESQAAAATTEPVIKTAFREALSAKEITDLAITKVKSLFGISLMKRDYILHGVSPAMIFDGVADSPDGGMAMFEVKVIPANRGLLRFTIDTYIRRVKEINASYSITHSHIYLILVFRGNNKQNIINHFHNNSYFRNIPHLSILYLNLDEL